MPASLEVFLCTLYFAQYELYLNGRQFVLYIYIICPYSVTYSLVVKQKNCVITSISDQSKEMHQLVLTLEVVEVRAVIDIIIIRVLCSLYSVLCLFLFLCLEKIRIASVHGLED